MEAARFSWLIVRSYMFMSEVNNRVRSRKQDLAKCLPGKHDAEHPKDFFDGAFIRSYEQPRGRNP
jgi:hypothetical protein